MDQPHRNAALGLEPIRTISRSELQSKLDRGDDFKLIMALNRWAFDAKHWEDAGLPLGGAFVAEPR